MKYFFLNKIFFVNNSFLILNSVAVLPVLPLPTPLPSTLNNKSQLFHPRVAEEAAILLATRDDNLVSLLLQSLMQTSVQHM